MLSKIMFRILSFVVEAVVILVAVFCVLGLVLLCAVTIVALDVVRLYELYLSRGDRS